MTERPREEALRDLSSLIDIELQNMDRGEAILAAKYKRPLKRVSSKAVRIGVFPHQRVAIDRGSGGKYDINEKYPLMHVSFDGRTGSHIFLDGQGELFSCDHTYDHRDGATALHLHWKRPVSNQDCILYAKGAVRMLRELIKRAETK